MFDDPPEGRAERARSGKAGRLALGLLLVLVFVAVLMGGGALAYYSWCQGAGGPQRPVTLKVPQGATGSETVARLHRQGVVRCEAVTRYSLSGRGMSGSVQAGTYHLTTNMEAGDALDALAQGTVARSVTLTIPEGYRLTQIASRVQSELGIPAKRFLTTATSGTYDLPPYLPKGKRTVEGFLFPTTYDFARSTLSSDTVIGRLLQEFGAQTEPLPWGNAAKHGVTPYEIVTIASMIEKEAASPSDGAKIASVIYNRLEAHMPLGIDATLLYVDRTPGDGLSESEIRSRSPYNTRLRTGLPPTPIASPQASSIRAALEPARTNFLYYLGCGKNGRLIFTSSYRHFLQLKSTCL